VQRDFRESRASK